MNVLVRSLKSLNVPRVKKLIDQDPSWLKWADDNGKNALHFLGDIQVKKNPGKEGPILELTRFFLSSGVDINSVHRIPEDRHFFPATPLWHAYTRGRNHSLYTFLLKQGANPQHCMYAIVWNNDVKAAHLFRKYGATLDDYQMGSTPFLAAVTWKRFEMATWLLKGGANIHASNLEGDTAFHISIKKNYPNEWIALLRKFGANEHQPNKTGKTPLNYAKDLKRRRILQALDI